MDYQASLRKISESDAFHSRADLSQIISVELSRFCEAIDEENERMNFTACQSARNLLDDLRTFEKESEKSEKGRIYLGPFQKSRELCSYGFMFAIDIRERADILEELSIYKARLISFLREYNLVKIHSHDAR